jgi:hypothetical protein
VQVTQAGTVAHGLATIATRLWSVKNGLFQRLGRLLIMLLCTMIAKNGKDFQTIPLTVGRILDIS